jgi:uncharacterized protein (DUF362 family)
MSLVSFVKVEKEDKIKEGILNALDLILYKFPTSIKNVVIKPNLCYYWDYTTGETTDPKFVAALIDLLREKISHEINISIVESDASAMKCKHVFKMLGYESLSKDRDAILVNLSEDKGDNVEVSVGNQSFCFMVPRTIRDADLKISIPKIKYTFEQIKLTCALKNIFGCNPYPEKFKYHSKIEEVIVAINKAMRFDLCIVDGIIVSGANPRRIGLVMSSRDSVAIDVAASKIAGINQNAIKYLSLAAKEGIGRTDFIQKGMPLDYFKAKYPRKNLQKKLMGKAYSLLVKLELGKRLGLD